MSFNYEKISAKEGEHGSWWTSYADLFMMLSIVFLLMYVASSLRNGTAGLQQQTEYKQLATRAEGLEQQIKVYNTLKEQQLQVAGDEEKKVYEKLMSKLSLLRDEAREEKENLTKKAKENEEKEYALNQYQRLVQSIINTNLIAKAKINESALTIDQQRAEQKKLIVSLENQKTTLARERSRFEADLNHQKLTAAARAQKLAEFEAISSRKQKGLETELSSLRDKMKDTETHLAGVQAEKEQAEVGKAQAEAGKAHAEAGKAKAEAEKSRALASVQQIQGDLDRTREIANAKKRLAKSIADSFARTGVKGAVDQRTGEVTLDFGEEYFETGRTDLKPKMKSTLDKFMPVYSKSLFNDKSIAEKIGSVEIVGFASSTYKGRYVNPKSLNPQDKDAIDYNLKLSFGRANSIFKYILNKNTLSKTEQEKLFPLIKVVGRGYLPEGKDSERAKSGMTEKEFCQRFNCKKAQRVVVKFNMKD